MDSDHQQFLQAAIEEAEKGKQENGIPIGSVLVRDGRIIGRGHNQRVQKHSVILHAEMDALENAGRPVDEDDARSFYANCTVYTTLAPCSMCTGAILLNKIPHVVVGENITFAGEVDLLRSRGVKVDIVQNERCRQLMKEFIQKHPSLWDEDAGLTREKKDGASEKRF